MARKMKKCLKAGQNVLSGEGWKAHSVGFRSSCFTFFGLSLQEGNKGLVRVCPDFRF